MTEKNKPEEVSAVSDELDGVENVSADRVQRLNVTWSDGNLNREFERDRKRFERLMCRGCGNVDRFEVLVTGYYETSARCMICGMYYIIHCG